MVSSGNTRILVDIGLSLRELQKRLALSGVDPATIDAVLITHEHGDHICGVANFLKKYRCRIYLHRQTVSIIEKYVDIDRELLETFDDAFQIGDIDINYFAVPHDSHFCFGYAFENGDCKIALATDLGHANDDIIANMWGAQIVMLECNHDIVKLTNNPRYPAVLKRRIMGKRGHLSNHASADAIARLASLGTQQIVLAHLSEQNNTPTLAFNFVREFLLTHGIIEGEHISIDIAEQHKPSRVYRVE